MKSVLGLFITLLVLILAVLAIEYLPKLKKPKLINIEDSKGGLDMVIKNYGKDIDSCAELFGINARFLKSLTMLECSGKKIFEERFEPHVYAKLKKVKFGQLKQYEHVTPEMLIDANDEAIRNLASSWGPFQLMGYKCLLLGIKVKDIRGENSIYYGVKWIDMTYGDYLKKNKFKDAFHIHNTGRPYPIIGGPRTHDPSYCDRGLKYMEYFKKNN